jgi:predicted small lipoprotein YifL
MLRTGALSVAVASLLAMAGCGAKTGLLIPDASMDAAVPDSPDAPDAPDSPDAPMCMPGRFPLAPDSAELMLVLDRSGSMRQTIEGLPDQPVDQWRWTILSTSLGDALSTLDARVHVGAKFFPDVITSPMPGSMEACACSPAIDVRPAAGTTGAILSLFGTTNPNGGTPTASALEAAATAFSTTPRRFVLLATDGAPNCNPDLTNPCVCTGPAMTCTAPRPGVLACLDDRATLGAIDSLLARGIPTYVVGIEDLMRPDFSDVLDQMALHGGRPRSVPGERAFYSVRSADQLHQALMDITSSISACGFLTPSLPGSDARFSIEIDGVLVPEDATNGWTWVDRAAGELELHGAACTAARTARRIESIIDACPQ